MLKVKTLVKPQVLTYLDKVGLILKIQFKFCIPKVILRTGFVMLGKIERAELAKL